MKNLFIVTGGLLFLASIAVAEAQKSAFPSREEAKKPSSSVAAPESSRQKSVKQLRMSSEVRLFRSKNGTKVLTNRPERYRGNKDYVEIAIKYDPIVVPNRYRSYSGANQYDAAKVAELVKHFARQYALEESLVYAVIQAESNFNAYAISKAGARGLMQLMPGTALDLGVRDVFDPAQNIGGGTQYLAKMLNLFKNDQRLALAAYNAGPETVKKYGTVPPFDETKDYVRRVEHYQRDFARKGVRPTYLAAGPAPDAASLPAQDKQYYTVRLTNGLTQPAEKVVEEDGLYFVTFEGITRLIRKDKVKEIVPPEKA